MAFGLTDADRHTHDNGSVGITQVRVFAPAIAPSVSHPKYCNRPADLIFVDQAVIDKWSLTSLQHRLVKTGGRLIKHARYYWLLLAESHLTRGLRHHAVEGRDGPFAGGIGGPPSATDFDDEVKGEEVPAEAIWNSGVSQCGFPRDAKLARCDAAESPLGLKTGLELRVCKPPGIDASLNQAAK